MSSVIADVLADGDVIVNQIVIDSAANPGDFGAVARVAPNSAIGWVKTAGAWGPLPAPAPTPEQLLAHANASQWALATGGFTVTVGGAAHLFATDVTSLTMMAGKVARLAEPSPPATINWQIGANNWLTIAATDFPAIATACADFVQASFDALKAVEAAIAAGTITTTAQIDAYAWPAP